MGNTLFEVSVYDHQADWAWVQTGQALIEMTEDDMAFAGYLSPEAARVDHVGWVFS